MTEAKRTREKSEENKNGVVGLLNRACCELKLVGVWHGQIGQEETRLSVSKCDKDRKSVV